MSDTLQSTSPSGDSEANSDEILLPPGTAMTEDTLSSILRDYSTPIIVLSGAAESGKTTLIASIHDSFQWSPFAGYLFSGSQTLLGFEERCFDSRASSEAPKPSTIRTRPEEGVRFYHLKLRIQDLASPIRNLVIADSSGEFYERATNSSSEMMETTIIRRADQFAFLVDGDRLTSEYAHTMSNAEMLMRRIFEEGILGIDARVDILLSKWDLVVSRLGDNGSDRLSQEFQDEFDRRFRRKAGRLRITPVAARPDPGSNLRPAHGMAELFQSWVEEPPRRVQQRFSRLRVPTPCRPFDAFAFRQAPEMFEGAK